MEDAIMRLDPGPVGVLDDPRLVADLGHHLRDPGDRHVPVAADPFGQRLADALHCAAQLVPLQVTRKFDQEFPGEKRILAGECRPTRGAEAISLGGTALRTDRAGALNQSFAHEREHLLMSSVAGDAKPNRQVLNGHGLLGFQEQIEDSVATAGEFEVRGPQALDLVQHLVTNDAATLTELAGVGEVTARCVTESLAGQEPVYLRRLLATEGVSLPEAAAALRTALRGDCHVHSDWSDGGSPIEEMALAAVELGHEYMVLTDHSPRLTVARGLTAARLRRQLDHVAARGDPGLLEVAGQRLGHLARIDLPVGDLDGGVAVLLLGAGRDDLTVLHLENGEPGRLLGLSPDNIVAATELAFAVGLTTIAAMTASQVVHSSISR